MSDPQTYMGYHWISIDDGVVTVGLSEDSVADLTDQIVLNLPAVDDSVLGGKVCGEVESDSGTINLYSPVTGTVIEINDSVLENPELLQEDPMDEGWLFKVEADDPEKLERPLHRAHSTDDDDEDEDEEEDEDEDDEDSDHHDGDDD